MKQYDVIVVGSGGGSKVTRPAADHGYKVAIIEKGELGGTCLNRGCIPSKMLIHPADVVSALREADRFSLDIDQNFQCRFRELVERVSGIIDAESASIAPLYAEHPNIDYYPHEARFVKDHVLRVNGEDLTAPKIFLPIGARPQIPNIPGLEGTPFMTYVEALRCAKQPKKLLVIGGGYIACELGYFFGALGSEIEFIVRSQMVRNEDHEIQEEFQRTFSQICDVHFGATPTQVVHENGEFFVTCEIKGSKPFVLRGDGLFVATGIVPNTDSLGLENTGIKANEKRYIVVDDHLETTVPGIFSFGDAIGRNLFRHTANYEGEYLVETQIKERHKDPIEYGPIPHAIFTNPQIAGVGKTEQQLRAEGVDYVVGLNRYQDSAMGMALRSENGFVKILVEYPTGKLLGGHIIGPEASNMVHMLIAYQKMGATVYDMLSTIFIHPALPEIVRNAGRKARTALQERGVPK